MSGQNGLLVNGHESLSSEALRIGLWLYRLCLRCANMPLQAESGDYSLLGQDQEAFGTSVSSAGDDINE